MKQAMYLAGCIAALGGLGLPARPAAALTFSFTTISNDTLTDAQRSAFQTAADAWSAVVGDAITVTLQVGFRSLGTSTLGQTTPTLGTVNANSVKALLAADATSAADRSAVASLPTYATGTSLLLTSAEARAIGAYAPVASDGIIEFSSDFAFSTSRNADGTIAAGTYDLVGIAEHEIGHVLGFVSQVDYGGQAQSVLDQFRFSAAGTRSDTAGASAYFSVDGGSTNLAAFSPGGSGNYQASHWANGSGYLMQPALAAGAVQNITALDLTAFDVIGYNLLTPVAVPEPGSALLVAGLLRFGVLPGRRARRPASQPAGAAR